MDQLLGPDLRRVAAPQTPHEYLQSVHRDIEITKRAQLFELPWLERLSRTPWWVVPLVWLPVAAALVGLSGPTPPPPSGVLAGFGFAGVVAWTGLEYSLHRWLFHYSGPLLQHARIRQLHFLFHGVHHKFPADRERLVMPPAAALLVAAPIYLAGYAIASFSPTAARGFPVFFAGLVFAYVLYDLLHYATHHAQACPGITRWSVFRRVRRRHLTHHYRDATQNFGITSGAWDIACATRSENRLDRKKCP